MGNVHTIDLKLNGSYYSGMSGQEDIRISNCTPRTVKEGIIVWLDERNYEIEPSWFVLPPWFLGWQRRKGFEAFYPNLVAHIPVPEMGKVILRIMIRKDKNDTLVSSENQVLSSAEERVWWVNIFTKEQGYEPDAIRQLSVIAAEEMNGFLEFLREFPKA